MDKEISVGDTDLDLGVRANQYILASREDNVGLVQSTTHGEKSSTEITPTTNVQPTNSIISQEDLDQLEKVNPLDAFDFLSQDVIFSKSTGKSSNVSVDDPSKTSRENLLDEFRSKVLGANLFEAIEQHENIIIEVKELLCKLGNLLSGSKFQEFSQVLEPLLESIGQGFQQKKAGQAKLSDFKNQLHKLTSEFVI